MPRNPGVSFRPRPINRALVDRAALRAGLSTPDFYQSRAVVAARAELPPDEVAEIERAHGGKL